ncbi:MAG: 4-hydroxythreonine-4-phosphate dehydrogenase PdxA [Candidatus Hinthialibacter antarcticus]|nr:4-hydroxythreonine-4-phosphate dehydrogenase PdxA [Candidatus Hinthialibacter antarcticus]
MSKSKPKLAVTMGDPSGVGPEIIAKAFHQDDVLQRCRPVIVGSERALQRAFEFTGVSFAYQTVTGPAEANDGVCLFNDETGLGANLPLAEIDASCGDAAFRWLSQAITWAKAGAVDAIVTAPLHKVAMNQAGHHFAGHTEILADQTDTEEFSLMLIAGGFRVVHVTCHVAMKEVSSMLTPKRIAMTVRLFNQALTRLDGKPPRIAVCAYNPHAGEEGLFGREEIDAIAPAVEQCKRDGANVFGPYPSDSIFPQLIGGKFDGVVAMYHDQGHIPFKTTNFGFDPDKGEWKTVTGVNVTLGLPIIRTSVDHGTAFDLAGTGKASERSLLDAIDVAIRLAE